MVGIIAYVMTGITLLTGSIVTSARGLSDKDKAIYKTAKTQQSAVDSLGFKGFSLQDYKILFYDGKKDYEVKEEDGELVITKQKPVLSTFAATAYEEDGEYEIIVPTLDKIGKMFDMLNSAGQLKDKESSSVSFAQDSYGEKEQVATIWHEAFHAYQFTKYDEPLTKFIGNHTFSEDDLGEAVIVEEVDENKEQKSLYEQELAFLKKAIDTTEVDTLKELILQYITLDEERTKQLSERARITEKYYKTVEGSARYVEAYVYRNLYSQKKFSDYYLANMDQFKKGSAKYYKVGMAECMLLDKLDANWKEEYDFSKSFQEILLNLIQK